MNAEIILEGSYLYYQGEVNYSQENFKLVHMTDQQQYHIYSEVLSRIDTGEFLKILVHYEMNLNFQPSFARIEKSIGNRYAQESFRFEGQSNDLKYQFQNSQGSQDFFKTLSNRHTIATPAFSTSTLFTLTKKFDPAGRTAVTLIGSGNEWVYDRAPEEKVIFADLKLRDATDFKINNNPLPASQLLLYQYDSSSATTEHPVEIYVSKHFGIPYQLTHGEQKIVIKNLKKNG
jgi:hypothetical protein